MGAEVQSKMYMPSYYSLRDLNDNAGNGSWSLHQQKNTFSEHRDFFLTRPATDVNEGNDKEQLKRTILKHEYVFRHQLHELHRVYKIQRDMMNEMRSKEPDKHMMQPVASQSSVYSSGFLVDEKARNRVSNLPLVDLNHRRLSMLGSDTIHCQFSSIKENTMQSSYRTSQNGIRVKDYETLESGCKRLRRRLFDLELPADTYMNDEEEGQGVSGVSMAENYVHSRNHEVTRDRDGIFSKHTGVNSGCYSNSPSPNLYLTKMNGANHLNGPTKIKEASASAGIDVLGNILCSKQEMERRVVSLNSHSGFPCLADKLSYDYQKGRDGGVSCNNVNLENGRKQKGWLAYNVEAGQTGSSGSSLCASLNLEDLPKTSKSRQVEPSNSHERATSLFSDKVKIESHVKRKLFGVEICERTPGASVEASSILVQPLVRQANTVNSESSSISSQKKLYSSLSQNISVQGNPSFSSFAQSNKSSVTLVHSHSRFVPGIGADGSYHNDRNSQLESKESWVCYSSNPSGHLNGISDSSSASEQYAQCGPKNNFKDFGSTMDAKFAEEKKASVLVPKRYQTEAVSDPAIVSVNETRKQNPQAGLSWLKVVPSCNGNSSEERQGSSQMNLNSLQKFSQQFGEKSEMIRKSSLQSFVQDSLSATCALDAEQWRTEVGECSSNRKILGFSISEKPLISKDLPSPKTPSAAVDGSDSVKVGSHDANGRDSLSPKLGEQRIVEGLTGKGLTNHHADSRNHIDLNLCFIEEEVEEKAQSSLSSSKTNLKIAFEIDLEAPVVVEEMDVSPGAESLESQAEEPVHMLPDESRLHEELINVAAESLVAISSSCVQLQVDADFHQSVASPSKTLHWFADIISSYKDDVENGYGSVSMDHDSVHSGDIFPDDGMDYFEFMTLNLTETKVEEEYHYEPQVLESPKIENTLPKRPRRNQARRGRQRKDFQRDVLPSVASLSKHEVTDDLQTIEGLIRATGGTWQSSLALKTSTRGGGGKGRRRVASSDPSANIAATCPPQQVHPPKCREAALEEKSLLGWGKRTRRPPRQRCSINNTPLTIK